MKKVNIIGAGLGAGSITADAAAALAKSQTVFGAERLLEEYARFTEGCEKIAEYDSGKIYDAVTASDKSVFSVLVSGDTGFYSASTKLCEVLADGFDLKVYPGISSLNAMFAALGRPWQNAALCSLHGRDCNAAEMVRMNRETFFLTGKNTKDLAEKLCNAGYEDIKLWVGQDLGSNAQKVLCCTAAELKDMELSSLTVVVAENPDADASVRTGIPDEEFLRGEVPMTKSEIRAVSLSKLGISPENTCADIGAGTGSCTVEMALSAWKGRVYAIETDPEGVELIKANCRKFHIGNVEIIEGLAPAAMEDMPAVDAAFVGGSKGGLKEIMAVLLAKNPDVRIVVNTIALQSLGDALEAFETNGLKAEVVQISAAQSKRAGRYDLLMARNPIFIISGGGKDRASTSCGGGKACADGKDGEK